MKLLLFLAAALFVRRGEAQTAGATSQGGMYYGAAGGVFGPRYELPVARIGPFGRVSFTGTNAVSFGGYNSGTRGYGRYGVRGGVYGNPGGGRRGAGVIVGRKMLQEHEGNKENEEKRFAVAAAAAAPSATSSAAPSATSSAWTETAPSTTAADATTCKTMLEIIQSRDDLSMLRELLEDIPVVRATLDAKIFTSTDDDDDDDDDNARRAAAAAEPLRLENGAYFTDTLFAPTDDAVLALLRHVSSPSDKAGDADELADPASSASREWALKALLGKGNATVATNFIAYHVVPDRRVKLPELEEGELLNTALGGQWRLMADRMKQGENDEDEEKLSIAAAVDGDRDGWGGDDGYDDGDGEAVIRGLGSQAGVLGGGLEACNGVVFVVDRVLLPVDLDGELNRRRGGRELPSTTRIACFDMHTCAR